MENYLGSYSRWEDIGYRMQKEKPFSTSAFGLAKGKELVSEDFFAVRVYDEIAIGIVCDGVGSALKGLEASRRVVNNLINNFKNRPKSWSIEKSLETFIRNINTILYRESIEQYERAELLTTLSIVVIAGNRLYGANVGDSPIYLLRDNHLKKLSFDQVSDEPGMEHVLLQAIGMDEEIEPYFFENNLLPNDTLLLCSDGLSNLLDEESIKSRIALDAIGLVKYASKKVDDNLPDDTSAVVIKYHGISTFTQLKEAKLEIPRNLKKGEVIDGYHLIKPLIQNERTWLVERNSQRYVMKFPLAEAVEDEQLLDFFIKEAWNAKRLKAGFFPKAAVPKNRSKRYYIMRYIDGITLKEYIKKKPLSIEDSVNLAKTLLHASQYLLKFDLVHGDIKPENIIITERHGKKVFKIIDFGSIVEIFSITSRAGTPSYLAPERFEGESISEQTEIFAIGVTLYEALTQRLPYGEIEPFQTPTFKSAKPLRTYNKMVPAWLESLIMNAIEPDKSRRYELYSEMEYQLSHPDKVKPYFQKSATLLEKYPAQIYRWLFVISFIVNMYLLFLLIKK